MNRRVKTRIITIAVLAALAAAVILSVDIRSVKDFFSRGTGSSVSGAASAGIRIDCSTILDHPDQIPQEWLDSGMIPADGILLEKDGLTVHDGESVFDLLLEAASAEKIPVEYGGGPAGLAPVYIRSIGGIREFSFGPLSGWMFRVNGTFAGSDSSAVKLQAGDSVEWVFTCDLGRDVGNSYD